MAGYRYNGTHTGLDTFDAVPEPRRMTNVKPCGTAAAYKRHQQRNEEPCDPCKAARLEYRRDYDQRTRARR